MGKMFEDLKEGLNDAINDVKLSKKVLRRNVIHIEPLVNYKPKDIKNVRAKVGMTQGLFANFLGVSVKTVEAWESGTNKPSGASNRLITMLDMDNKLVNRFPFVNVLK